MKKLFAILAVCAALGGYAQEMEHEHSIYHSFIENKGQWHDDVLFQSKFNGGNLWVQQRKFVFHLQDFSSMHDAHVNHHPPIQEHVRATVVHLNFKGAQSCSKIEKINPTKQYYNYFLGNDSQKWAADVHGYSEAILSNIYDGIDLKLIEQKMELKYEFHVQPMVSPELIQLEFVGQKAIEIDKKGNLRIHTELGQIIEEKPYAYQIKNGRIEDVQCAFRLENGIVRFELGTYDPNVILVIDPVLVFATYAGSVTDNFGMTATFASDGSAYSAGTIYGNAYPTPDNNAYDVNSNFTVPDNPTYGITDVFLSKYSSDGTTMLWTTFLGGGNQNQGTETAHSLIADAQDNVYVYGATSSTDFPIVNGYQAAHAGGVINTNFFQNGVYYTTPGTDIFVARVSSNGHNLMASTYMGGTANDGVNYDPASGLYSSFNAYSKLVKNYGDQFRGEIMLDPSGNCLVASTTRSTNFPTVNAFQAANAGSQDGVIFKLSSDLSNLIWSSYYGGSSDDACYSVKVDSSNFIVFAGGTRSSDLPNTGSGWNPSYMGGEADGFVSKLSPDGLTLLQGSYIGDTLYDQVFFVEIDRNDNVFIVGQTEGGNYPVINAAYSNPNSSQFITKLTPDLSTALNSTVFGNGSDSLNISPSAFLVDICGNVYVSGWGAHLLQTQDSLIGMPITGDAYISNPPDGFDFYLFVLRRDFADVLYASYLGSASSHEHVDGGTSRFDKNGVVYQSVCGGCGGDSQFPTYPDPGVWSDTNLSTNCNNIVFKFDFQLIPNAEFTVDQNTGCAVFEVTFDNFSTVSDSYLWDFGNGDTSSVIFEPTVVYDTPGTYEVYLYVTDSVCLLTDTAQITITVTDSIELSTSTDLELCEPELTDLIAYTNGAADTFIWSTDPTFSDTLNADLSDSILTVTPTEPTTYYVMVSNPGCSYLDSIQVDFIGSSLILNANDSLCLGQSTLITATNTNPTINFTYVWEPDSILISPNGGTTVSVLPSVTQYVYVTASASTGCVVEDSILIHVGTLTQGQVQASASEYTVPEGGEVELFGLPAGYSYSWSPSSVVDQPNAQNTSARIDEPTLFTLTVFDGICLRSDTVLVQTFPYVCAEPYVFVPNVFTPNGDGENDVLYVKSAVLTSILFRIYDRWGELVFETTSTHVGWNGEFRGKPMDPDVYDYYLEAVCVGGQEAIIKGNITLMK